MFNNISVPNDGDNITASYINQFIDNDDYFNEELVNDVAADVSIEAGEIAIGASTRDQVDGYILQANHLLIGGANGVGSLPPGRPNQLLFIQNGVPTWTDDNLPTTFDLGSLFI